MMVDSGAMYALTQLHAELQAKVEANAALIRTLSDGLATLRRTAGVFYDAGVEDTLKRVQARGRHTGRHLRSVDK